MAADARATSAMLSCARRGTERPFTSPLNKEHRRGAFVCAGCALPLFSSAAKFDSGTGWPSFWKAAAAGGRDSQPTAALGMMVRTEVLCARCGGHLGHVFDDGPKPTGLRYCMNGLALRFRAGLSLSDDPQLAALARRLVADLAELLLQLLELLLLGRFLRLGVAPLALRLLRGLVAEISDGDAVAEHVVAAQPQLGLASSGQGVAQLRQPAISSSSDSWSSMSMYSLTRLLIRDPPRPRGVSITVRAIPRATPNSGFIPREIALL